jgi:hypothetical protein
LRKGIGISFAVYLRVTTVNTIVPAYGVFMSLLVVGRFLGAYLQKPSPNSANWTPTVSPERDLSPKYLKGYSIMKIENFDFVDLCDAIDWCDDCPLAKAADCEDYLEGLVTIEINKLEDKENEEK